jgi:hypothetical protein
VLSQFKDSFQEYKICMTETIARVTWLNTLLPYSEEEYGNLRNAFRAEYLGFEIRQVSAQGLPHAAAPRLKEAKP